MQSQQQKQQQHLLHHQPAWSTFFISFITLRQFSDFTFFLKYVERKTFLLLYQQQEYTYKQTYTCVHMLLHVL